MMAVFVEVLVAFGVTISESKTETTRACRFRGAPATNVDILQGYRENVPPDILDTSGESAVTDTSNCGPRSADGFVRRG